MTLLAGIFDSPAELMIIMMSLLVGGGVGYLIGRPKGQGPLGLLLGALLGCLGWVIVAVLPRKNAAGAMGAPAPMSPMTNPGSGGVGGQWAPDPFGRFQSRYHDGTKWTEHVATDGRQYTDHPS